MAALVSCPLLYLPRNVQVLESDFLNQSTPGKASLTVAVHDFQQLVSTWRHTDSRHKNTQHRDATTTSESRRERREANDVVKVNNDDGPVQLGQKIPPSLLEWTHLALRGVDVTENSNLNFELPPRIVYFRIIRQP